MKAPTSGKKVTRANLAELKTSQYTHILYCRKCGSNYSADWNDYSFHSGQHDALKCCKVNLWLLEKP